MLLTGTIVTVKSKSGSTSYRIRIHAIHKAKTDSTCTPDEQLPEVEYISTAQGLNFQPENGKNVIVGFDKGNYQKPVILGICETQESFNEPHSLKCPLIETAEAKLPRTVEIPSKDNKSIVDVNLQSLQDIGDKVINTELVNLGDSITDVSEDLSNHLTNTSVHITDNSISNLKLLTVSNSMFGRAADLSAITNPVEGQIFFVLED